MTRKEAFDMHQCIGCVLYDSKRSDCKKLDLPLSDRPIDICPVDNELHYKWKKQVDERRIR